MGNKSLKKTLKYIIVLEHSKDQKLCAQTSSNRFRNVREKLLQTDKQKTDGHFRIYISTDCLKVINICLR